MNNFDLLKEWVIQNGGYVHPAIYRKKNENGIYGLFTNQDLNPNEVLIKVPESIFINENTNNINFNGLWINKEKCLFNMCIELEKEDSKYKLPLSQYPNLDFYKKNFIVFANDNLKKIFSNISHIYKEQITNQLKNIELLEKKFNSDLIKNKSNILRCYFIWLSYAWDNLNPLVDLFNHKDDEMPRRSYQKNSIIQNKNLIKKDNEILISYGYKSPLNFAIQYGFFDKLNTKYILLHPRFTSKKPIDFYKAKLLIDLGWNCKIQNGKIIIEMTEDKLYCSSTDLSEIVTKSFQISSANTINEIEIFDKKRIFNFALMCVNVELDRIDMDYVELVEDHIPENYQYLISAVKYNHEILINLKKNLKIAISS